jgi:hypothetical protein
MNEILATLDTIKCYAWKVVFDLDKRGDLVLIVLLVLTSLRFVVVFRILLKKTLLRSQFLLLVLKV